MKVKSLIFHSTNGYGYYSSVGFANIEYVYWFAGSTDKWYTSVENGPSDRFNTEAEAIEHCNEQNAKFFNTAINNWSAE